MKINDGYNVGKKKKGAAVTLITAVLLLAAAAVSVLIGRYSITPDMLWEILFHGDTPLTEEAEAASLVLFETRIARSRRPFSSGRLFPQRARLIRGFSAIPWCLRISWERLQERASARLWRFCWAQVR